MKPQAANKTTGVKITSTILLIINGIGALSAGIGFIRHPDGSAVGIDISVLKYSPFSNFLIPGILLFIFNGLCSLIALFLVYSGNRNAGLSVLVQGVILLIWIIVQVIMLQTINPLHLIFFLIGCLLCLAGFILRKKHPFVK